MRSTLDSPAVKRLLLAALWLAGCTQTVVVGSRYVKSERIAAGAAANLVVTIADEPALAGTTLQVPTGALASDTTLTLELGSTDIADDPSGPVAVWGPSGTTFATPATLSLPFTLPADATTSELEVEVLEDNGTRITLPNSALVIDTTNRLVRFSVSGFTRFQPKRHRPCTSNAKCNSGQFCLAGDCVP